MWRLLPCIAFVACFGAAVWANASGASTLLCDYRSADHVLTCAPKEGKPSDWTFQIKDGTTSGTLVLPEGKTLYRKMNLKRIRKSA
jgi:hypothetical protein